MHQYFGLLFKLTINCYANCCSGKKSQLLLEGNSQPLRLAQLERKGTGEVIPKANREDSSFPKRAYEFVTPEEWV